MSVVVLDLWIYGCGKNIIPKQFYLISYAIHISFFPQDLSISNALFSVTKPLCHLSLRIRVAVTCTSHLHVGYLILFSNQDLNLSHTDMYT